MTAIGEDPHDQQDAPPGDYSYDLVHDEVPDARRPEHTSSHASGEPSAGPDVGGDYSYDLAHEVPPSPQR